MSYKLVKPYTQMQKNEFIVEYNRARGLLIEETPNALYALEKNEVMQDGIPIVNPTYEADELAKAKAQKHEQNLEMAYKAEEEGSVLYKDAVFETSASNVSKLTSQFAMMQLGVVDSVQWLSKNDIQIELKASDIIALGQLISDYTSALWNVQYLSYKEQIDAAETMQDLLDITLDY